ncbi:MAG: Dabb family protein [Bacteroidetes bacterium]|nr:Dabb family protein [Bacteroidota bacterium]MDA1122334.1 Dabb family protein [Bacteroidota bacterium]
MLGNFYHVVYFWLKEPENQSDRKQFLASLNGFLDQVDEIKTRHVGSPAPTNRPVIDSSYTFSLILSFKNKNEQDIYQEHAAHKKFIADSKALWQKVQVYDSELL